MTQIEDKLLEIEAVAEKCSKGWHIDPRWPLTVVKDTGYYICACSTVASGLGEYEAKFIAASRTDVPRLVEALRIACEGLNVYNEDFSGETSAGNALTQIQQILTTGDQEPE